MSNQLTKLAKLAHSGAAIQAIADSFNVNVEQINQLIETDEYKLALSKIAEEAFESAQILDQGWEGIENFAVSKVLDELQSNPDPEFALKAASIANKAIRRNGGFKPQTAIQVNVQNNAIIKLQPIFAKNLQENYLIDDVKGKNTIKKITNALNPSKVKELLRSENAQVKLMGNIMNEFSEESFV